MPQMYPMKWMMLFFLPILPLIMILATINSMTFKKKLMLNKNYNTSQNLKWMI